MKFRLERYVRFEEPSSVNFFSPDRQSSENGFYQTKIKPSVSAMMESIQTGCRKGYEAIRSLKRSSTVHPLSDNKPTTKESSCTKKKILDPQGPFLQRWNKIFVLTCVLAVALDPLFFYIPVVNDKEKCLDLDKKMQIIACVLRSVTDLFYIIHIIFQFRTGFIAPSSRVFGRGELIVDPYAIAKGYLSSYFIVDILSILPVPQVTVIMVIPSMRGPVALITKDLLKFVILIQYIPRFFRIFPLYREVTRTSGLFTETPWAGAAFNLFLYMLASHIIGACWYLIAIERKDRCWRDACKSNNCNVEYLYCGKDSVGNNEFLNTSCPLLEQSQIRNSTDFDFGILLDALQSRIVETRDFPKKLIYCFWWGLRSLSSLGQNLRTSTFVGEILFAVLIAIIGLVLFSLLIGNMQKYLQSITVRVEEMRIQRRDAELWMSHRMLPDNLKVRIRRYEQYKWQETRGVDEESLIDNLPKDLKRDIKHHLCWSLVTRVPMFEKMDEQLLDAMCDRLKPVLYTEKSFLVREGDPVDEMLFVMRGDLLTMTTNGGRTGFFNSVYLKAGDFCGEELLTWALDPTFSSSLPSSTRTVQALTDVQAFALMADDLKFVATQFRRLNSKQIQHTFRFSSQQWRTWGACFIQAAWRTHCRKKLEKALREEEDKLHATLAQESGTPPSLGATIYASRFAVNALRALKRNHSPSPILAHKVPPLLLQKPAEPDFSVGDLR